jgi:hypothetical protein
MQALSKEITEDIRCCVCGNTDPQKFKLFTGARILMWLNAEAADSILFHPIIVKRSSISNIRTKQ